MKNITLSMPEDLVEKARAYAQKNGTSMNEMIRELLRIRVEKEEEPLIERLAKYDKTLGIDTRIKFNREDLYDR